MRKLIAIPLLVLYITAVSGMIIQLHFCGSKLLSWNVNKAKASCCCESSPKTEKTMATKHKQSKEEDCCKDKTITLKIKQDQNRTNQLQLQLNAMQIAPVVSYSVPPVFVLTQTDAHTAYKANAPPGLWQNIPLYKLHARFTYYG